MIIRFGRLRTTFTESDRTTSTILGALRTARASSRAFSDGVTDPRSTVRPSAFETIFCAITTTSRSRKLCSARSRPADISADRSSPARTRGRPATANNSKRSVILPEAFAQFRQDQFAIEFQEAGLVRARGMKHQMIEAKVDIGLQSFDMLVWVG